MGRCARSTGFANSSWPDDGWRRARSREQGGTRSGSSGNTYSARSTNELVLTEPAAPPARRGVCAHASARPIARGWTSDGVIAIAVDHRFAVPLREGFDYITDSANWSEYWPGLVAIKPASRWGRVGDRARLSLRMMGRPTELVMTLGKPEPSGRSPTEASSVASLPPSTSDTSPRPATGSTTGSSSAIGRGGDCAVTSTGLSSAVR